MEQKLIKNRKTIEENNETKYCHLKKINKIDKPLTRLRKTERTKIINIRNDQEDITTDPWTTKG